MRTILAVLILGPLAVAVLLLVALIALAYERSQTDVIGPALVLVAICAALTWAARRMLRREGSLLTFPGSDTLDPGVRRALTRLVVAITCLVLGGYTFVILEIEHVRGWLGMVFIVLAMVHVYGTICRFRQVLRRSSSAELRLSCDSVHLLGSGVGAVTPRASIFVAVGVMALTVAVVVYYAYLGGSQYLEPVDVVGFCLLAVTFAAGQILGGLAMRRILGAVPGNGRGQGAR